MTLLHGEGYMAKVTVLHGLGDGWTYVARCLSPWQLYSRLDLQCTSQGLIDNSSTSINRYRSNLDIWIVGWSQTRPG